MLSANFFQASNHVKREMDKKFKELGYTLPMKKMLLNEVVGHGTKLNGMTIGEMEDVIKYLDGYTIIKIETQ